MNRIILLGVIAALGLGVIAALNVFFIVPQTQYALVLQFGEIRRVIREPGLNIKRPVVEEVRFLDKRILPLDMPREEVIASDRKRLVVDAFARYRIIEPATFYRAVRNEGFAEDRLRNYLSSVVRNRLGAESFAAVLSDKRSDLMLLIRDVVNDQARPLGIEIVDVRIRRADLPEANSQAIYQRMQTERQQEAAEIRAEGGEESLRIRSQADREVTILLAEARRDSEITRGQGDAQRNNIFADAFGRDPDFFGFYRSMRAYEGALKEGDTTFVLRPDSEFFRYFGELEGLPAAP